MDNLGSSKTAIQLLIENQRVLIELISSLKQENEALKSRVPKENVSETYKQAYNDPKLKYDQLAASSVMQEDCKTLKDNYDAVRSENTIQMHKIKALKSEIEALKASQKKSTSDKASKKASFDKLQKQHRNLAQKHHALKMKYSASGLSSSDEYRTTTEALLRQKDSQIKSLMHERNVLKMTIKHEEWKFGIQDLENRNLELLEENHHLEKENLRCSKEIKALKAQLGLTEIKEEEKDGQEVQNYEFLDSSLEQLEVPKRL
ncbi:hypothetical protein L596_025751 [Steinernema carpocapsae]|uniref:Uncharacterized protein n=1 Tax=Steinernema carpocapsae TaxID=34508 RepID=A0A4U5M9N2_STECR|nr:hypothetical protein L596_025751 [Steinernema carpocapsae]